MATLALVLGRILLAIIFIISGVNKLQAPEQTGAMLQGAGLPAALALPTGMFELVAGACLAVGVLSRIVPLLLAGFTVLATLYFHSNISDPMQASQAMKNLAIIGGLLAVFAASHARRTVRVVETTPAVDDRYDRIDERGRAEDRALAAERRARRAEAVDEPLDHRAEDRAYDREARARRADAIDDPGDPGADDRAYERDLRADRIDAMDHAADRYPVRRPWFRRWF